MSENTKQGQHFIPRFYLEGFCDHNNCVWKYVKNDPLIDPIPLKPKDIAVYNGLYALQNVPRECINNFERFISDTIESPSVSVLDKIRKVEQLPAASDREVLAMLIAWQFIRTPGYIVDFSKMISYEEMNLDVSKIKSSKEMNSHLRKIASNKGMKLHQIRDFSYSPKNKLLIQLVKLAEISSELLLKMKWNLIKTTSDYPFIISDNLLRIYNPHFSGIGFLQPGLGHKDSEVVFPLSKDLMLHMINSEKHKDGMLYDAKNSPELKNEIKRMNKDTYLNADEFVIASLNSPKLKSCFKKIHLDAV